MPIIVFPHTFHDGVGEQASGVQVMDNFNAVLAAIEKPEAWKKVSSLGYTNSWIDEAPTPGEYRKMPWGDVQLRGAIKSGASSTAAFTLPAGYRPLVVTSLIVAAGGGLGYLQVNTSGAVVPASLSGGNVTVYCHLESFFSTE